MLQQYRYHFLLHLIIFMWGFTGILGKLIELDALLIVWHRLWIAALALAVYMFLSKKLILPKGKTLLYAVLVGLVVALHWITFYTSIQLSTASLGILCLSTTTLHVTWLEPLIMGKKFSWIEFAMGLLVIGGIYFVAHDFKGEELKALGIGLSSALCAGIFSVSNGKLAHHTETPGLSLTELSTGFIALSLFFLFQGKWNLQLFEMTSSDFYWLLFLGVICTSFAFLATIDIVKRLGAFSVSLSINLEPIYTILLAIVLLKEHKLLETSFYWGAAMILTVLLANGIWKHKQRKIANINDRNAIQ
ncbi:MAG: EamA family transporter [Sphingomonadales bacterium]|nr:EamA family transporter [Sphingomonadales bacterium]